MQRVRKCSNSVAPDAGTCHFGNSAASRTRRKAAAECSLPLVQWKGATEYSHLFVENKHARLAGKTNFFHLPAFADEHRVVSRLGTAVFPAPLGLGNDLLASLDGGFVPIDLQSVFAGFQVSLAESRSLCNVDGPGDGFREERHGQGDGCQQGDTAEK